MDFIVAHPQMIIGGLFFFVVVLVLGVSWFTFVADSRQRGFVLGGVIGAILVALIVKLLSDIFGFLPLITASISLAFIVSIAFVAYRKQHEDSLGLPLAIQVAMVLSLAFLAYLQWPIAWNWVILVPSGGVAAWLGARLGLAKRRAEESQRLKAKQDYDLRKAKKWEEQEARRRALDAATESRRKADELRREAEAQRRSEVEEQQRKEELARLTEIQRQKESETRAAKMQAAREKDERESRLKDERSHDLGELIVSRENDVLAGLYALSYGQANASATVTKLANRCGMSNGAASLALKSLVQRGQVRDERTLGYQRRWSEVYGELASWFDHPYSLTLEGARAARRLYESRSTTTHGKGVTFMSPRANAIRVLYLTTNPSLNLRTEQEVRDVREHVLRAVHRDRLSISVYPAATPQDILNGLNDTKPHVVHFSGHASERGLLFELGEGQESRLIAYNVLASVLAATKMPPRLVVLNGCETLHGADALLDTVEVVIGMLSTVSDLAARMFAAQFYAAIAADQTIQAALDQGTATLQLAGGGEDWKPQAVVRDGVDLTLKDWSFDGGSNQD